MSIIQLLLTLYLHLSVMRAVSLANNNSSAAREFVITLKSNADLDNHIRWLKETLGFDIGAKVRSLRFDDSVIYSTTLPEAVYEFLTSELSFSSSDVEMIEPNVRVKIATLQQQSSSCDNLQDSSWALTRITQRDKFNRPNDNIDFDRDFGNNTQLYIVDTGLSTKHQELFQLDKCETRVRLGFAAPGFNSAEDDNGHGTFVASIAAGTHIGVARSTSLVAVKVLDSQGEGSLIDIVDGLNWAMNDIKDNGFAKGKSIINMSLGAPRSQTLNRAIKRVSDQGVPIVVAAGNEDTNACLTSPASESSAISVGATTRDDRLAKFSNYGSCVDILAPGEFIFGACTDCDGTQCFIDCPDVQSSGYVNQSGTSFSAPLVAAVIASYQTSNTELNNESDYVKAVTDKLVKQSTEDKISGLGFFKRTANLLLFI